MRGTGCVLLVMLLSCAGDAFGCGDKLLVLGRGIRFGDIHKAVHAASILIYMNPGSQLPLADKEVLLQTVLKLAGHKPKSVKDRSEFSRALTSGAYDVVLADLPDAGALKNEVAAAPSKPILLPVLYNPSPDQLAAAQKEYSCPFKAAKKNYQFLGLIDEAVASKRKGTDPKCPPR